MHKEPEPFDPDWVKLFGLGVSIRGISALTGARQSSVRQRIYASATSDPGLLEKHRSASHAPTRVTVAGLRNMKDIVALFEAEGRLPSFKSPRERSLAAWLQRRQEDETHGVLASVYREGLMPVAGWTRKRVEASGD
jgi:hypothetical protein